MFYRKNDGGTKISLAARRPAAWRIDGGDAAQLAGPSRQRISAAPTGRKALRASWRRIYCLNRSYHSLTRHSLTSFCPACPGSSSWGRRRRRGRVFGGPIHHDQAGHQFHEKQAENRHLSRSPFLKSPEILWLHPERRESSKKGANKKVGQTGRPVGPAAYVSNVTFRLAGNGPLLCSFPASPAARCRFFRATSGWRIAGICTWLMY